MRKVTIAHALKRLWSWATCNHQNRTIILDMGNKQNLVWCGRCGRVLYWDSEHDRHLNPHRIGDQLDAHIAWTANH